MGWVPSPSVVTLFVASADIHWAVICVLQVPLMLRRLRSLQEQCRSKPSLPERPFCNIGKTSQQLQTSVANGSESLQQDFVENMSCVSTPKQNSDLLASNCLDTVVEDDRDLPSFKRSHSEVDNGDREPSVDHILSPPSSSPARKRLRQDTLESVTSENIATTAVDTAASPSQVAAAACGKSSASPTDKSFDSTNVELSSSVVCEPSSASAAFGFSRSGSCTQLSLGRPASVGKSANSSPRTLSSRRDFGWSLTCLDKTSSLVFQRMVK